MVRTGCDNGGTPAGGCQRPCANSQSFPSASAHGRPFVSHTTCQTETEGRPLLVPNTSEHSHFGSRITPAPSAAIHNAPLASCARLCIQLICRRPRSQVHGSEPAGLLFYQCAVAGADPERAFAIRQQRGDAIVLQRRRIVGVEGHKADAVEPRHPDRWQPTNSHRVCGPEIGSCRPAGHPRCPNLGAGNPAVVFVPLRDRQMQAPEAARARTPRNPVAATLGAVWKCSCASRNPVYDAITAQRKRAMPWECGIRPDENCILISAPMA